jgi:hypothetical protein
MRGTTWITTTLLAIILAACSLSPQPDSTPWPEQVDWPTAVEILHGGHVEAVMQLHNLSVTFLMDDGSQIKTVEPVIDEIFLEVDLCGKPCQGITLATE